MVNYRVLVSACLIFLCFTIWNPTICLATKCGERQAFLELRQALCDQKDYRVAHVRVVRAKITPTSEEETEFFEIVEFWDQGGRDRTNERFLATGSLSYHLNFAPKGVHEPFPAGSEWILMAMVGPHRISPSTCGSILELKNNMVRGLIRKDSQEQEMAVSNFRKEINSICGMTTNSSGK